MIIIVDYGLGNLRSILHKLERIGTPAMITSEAGEIAKAQKLILPGVGAFDKGMFNLKEYGLIPILNQKVLVEKTPILGICLGMQLFCKCSEEGTTEGLGWLDAECRKFKFGEENAHLKVPHMGWNTLTIKREHFLLKDMPPDAAFYFVHTFYVVCNEEHDILAQTRYGFDFTSVIQRNNIWGTQFHPEKSHKSGIQLLKNFAEYQNVENQSYSLPLIKE